MKTPINTPILAALLSVAFTLPLYAQSSVFTYQGSLNDGMNPANGIYDLEFAIYDAATNGVAISVLTNAATKVSDGLFTVTLDFGSGAFDGNDRWLEIAARTNGSGAFSTLSPRQQITSTPYAIKAAGVDAAGLMGTISPTIIEAGGFTGAFTGDGSNLTNLDASALGGTVPSAALGNAWQVTGNAGTTPGTDSIGTTDNEALELKVNQERALRLEPTVFPGSPNVIAGSAINTVTVGNYEATIGGGRGNQIGYDSPGATIAGGILNLVGSNSAWAVISGGQNNTIDPDATGSFIAGGANLTIEDAEYAVIGGGQLNEIQPGAHGGVVSGGKWNVIHTNAPYSTVAGGIVNRVDQGNNAVAIGGGLGNRALTGASFGMLPGGLSNVVQGAYSLAAGRKARAEHHGAFVWADSTDTNFASIINNEFAVRASGGARFETGGAGLMVDGQPVLNGLIGTSNLTDASVTSAKLADEAVTSKKLQDGATLLELSDNDGIGSGLDADLLDGLDSVQFWNLDGNIITVPGFQFLGTRHDQAMDFKVNNRRAFRLEPANDPAPDYGFSPNLIGGYESNVVEVGVIGATISGGGRQNYAHTITAHHGTIGGGDNNHVHGEDGTIAGGGGNLVGSNSWYAAIGGGLLNEVRTNAFASTVAGGNRNTIHPNAAHSTIGGGRENTIHTNAEYATIPGGRFNTATNFAFAAGFRAQAVHEGAFVWADSQNADFASTATDQFSVRAAGGARFVGPDNNGSTATLILESNTQQMLIDGNELDSNGDLLLNFNSGNHVLIANASSRLGVGVVSPSHPIEHSSGAHLTAAGVWTSVSDLNAKEQFAPIDPVTVLAKVVALPVTQWKYKVEGASVKHIGPVAQDFHAAFGLGESDKAIGAVDADGVALAAIQGLNEKVERGTRSAELRVEKLEEENSALKSRLTALENLIANLNLKGN